MLAPLALLRIPTETVVLSTSVAAESGSADPSSLLVQYGVLGLVVAVLGPFAWQSYKWQVQRGDKLEARNEELTKLYTDKILPAVLASNEAVQASQNTLHTMAPLVRELIDALAVQTLPRNRPRGG